MNKTLNILRRILGFDRIDREMMLKSKLDDALVDLQVEQSRRFFIKDGILMIEWGNGGLISYADPKKFVEVVNKQIK